MAGVAGMGGVGTGGSTAAEQVPGCEAAEASVTGSAAHAGALSVIGQMMTCGISLCHGGTVGQAKLVLLGATDLKATLADKPSCEAPTMPLVDSRGGDVALGNSWLWQKLTAPTDEMDVLIVQPSWGTPGTCPTTGFGSMMTSGFGSRMPKGGRTLEAPSLAPVRNWICAGAPGP